MLTIRIEKNHPSDLLTFCAARPVRSAQPVCESCFNRFAFALILRVNNYFGPGFASSLFRLIG